jgi:hypothetical protein
MKQLSKITLSLAFLVLSVFTVSKGFALFTDVITAKDNKFYSGSYDIQISKTDLDNNNIAEADGINWGDNVVGAWTTPLLWTPGQIVDSKIFIRNLGQIDAESLLWHLGDRTFYGAQQLDQVINIIKVWYDRNGNAIEEAGEDLLPQLMAVYNTNGGVFTLRELFDGTDIVHGGTAFDLEAGVSVLPGSKTNVVLGGNGGTGKGLFLTWQYEPSASVIYANSWVDVDFVFTGEQKVN